MIEKHQFASDNYAGILPEALHAINHANEGFAYAYGNDPYTQKAVEKIQELFDIDAKVFFVFNGTAANSLALSSLCQSYHSVICSDVAHVETDECGAPEFFSNGTKILTTPNKLGKLDVSAAEKAITRRNDVHYPKPKVISISSPTETGTVYTIEEMREIESLAKKYDLRIHMDGARFANAVASLKCKPSEITWKVGVDILCFGGTKLGLPYGEAIVFFNRKIADEFAYRMKQAGQLASKMRYISAPWIKILDNNVWLKYAEKANENAQYFYENLKKFPQIKTTFPCQANSVFVQFPPKIDKGLKEKGWYYYSFIGVGQSRFMFSWNTQRESVNALLKDIEELTH